MFSYYWYEISTIQKPACWIFCDYNKLTNNSGKSLRGGKVSLDCLGSLSGCPVFTILRLVGWEPIVLLLVVGVSSPLDPSVALATNFCQVTFQVFITRGMPVSSWKIVSLLERFVIQISLTTFRKSILPIWRNFYTTKIHTFNVKFVSIRYATLFST